jgi:hypothetical protein
MHTIE